MARNISRSRLTLLAASASLVAASIIAAPAATLASGGNDDIIRTGSCAASSDWKIKVKKDDGRIEVEFEVDSNVNGQTWNVALKQDGNNFFTGQRVTQPPSGSFEVERRASDLAGVHTFTGRARNPNSGEVCRGSVQI